MEGGIDESDPEFLEAQRNFEVPLTAAAVKVRDDLCAFYAIPEAILLSRVPPILKAVDDHILFPFSTLLSDKRWMRVSSLAVLKDVCFRCTRVLDHKTLMLFIMPYISTNDAFLLHQLVTNPGKIHLASHSSTAAAANDSAEEGQTLPMEGRSGVLVVPDPMAPSDSSRALHFDFLVVNYGLLSSKAVEHLRFVGTSTQARELLHQIENHRHQILEGPAASTAILDPQYLPSLEEKIEDTKVDLLLLLYQNGIDPHAAILSMDMQLHEDLYGIGYDPCYPNDRTAQEMREITDAAVHEYMLEREGTEQAADVKEAESNVLEAEGWYEAEAHRAEAIKSFCDTLQKCTTELTEAVNRLNFFDCRASLLGVRRHDIIM